MNPSARGFVKLLGTLLLVAVALFFYYKVYIPKHSYRAIHPILGDMNLTLFGIATVEAKRLYPIASVYGGKILRILKEQGQSVKRGELIARIDPVDLPEQISQAKAHISSIHFNLLAARKDLESLRARLKLAQIIYERYQKLSPKGYSAKSEYDKARADLESIQAQIGAKEAQIDALKAEKIEASYSIKALQKRLSRYSIYAPVSGIVISQEAQPSQNIAPQQSIITIVRPKDVWVSATIDEALSKDINVGDRAAIRLRSRPHETFAGYVARIEPQSDPVTQERIVEVAFKKLPRHLYLKEQAEVRIDAGVIRNAYILPLCALKHGGIWIDKGGKAHFKKIKVLAQHGAKAAIKGLRGDEIILLPDPHKKSLIEGMRVYR